MRRTFKRATNSDHAGAMYSCVVVSSRDDVQRFADNVGFDHPDKHARLHDVLKRGADTNTDVVPIGRDSIRELRQALSLSMLKLAALAGCSRPMISLMESGQRQPSRKLLGRLLDALSGEARRRGDCTFAWWKQWRALHRLCEMRWMPIKSLDRIQYDHPYVYDLSVPGPETFLAGTGGVFVHNTYWIASASPRCSAPLWCSLTTRRWRRSSTASSVSSFRTMLSSTSFRTTTTTSRKPTSRPRIPISRRTRRSISTSSRCASRRPRGSSNGRTSSSSRRCPRSTASATPRRIWRWSCTWCAARSWISASSCGALRTCSTRATSSISNRRPTACAATSSISFRRSPIARRFASSSTTRKSGA